MTKKIILLFFGVLILAGVLFAQNFDAAPEDSDWRFSLAGIRIWGLDLQLDWYGLEFIRNENTILHAVAGGGYEQKALPRNLTTGDPVLFKDISKYYSTNFQWEAGIVQGYLKSVDDSNMWESFLYYRGGYDINIDPPVSDLFPDLAGGLRTAFLAGVGYDTVGMNNHGLKSGSYIESSIEYAPGFLNRGLIDYWRVNQKFYNYFTLFDLYPERKNNVFGSYLATLLSLDYSDGNNIPTYIQQSFGGRDVRDSLGDCVRGYNWTTYDTKFKAVGNIEARFAGPDIVLAGIRPVILFFIDGGYWNAYDKASESAEDTGYLASGGTGAVLDVLGFMQLGAWVSWRLIEDTYEPGERFAWGISTAFHF